MAKRDEAMQMLDQLENALIECEKAPRENTPTMRSFLMVLRVVYYLLRQHILEKPCKDK